MIDPKQIAALYRPVNLDAVTALDKNVVEAALNVHWKGYGAEPTALAGEAWENLGDTVIKEKKPAYGNLHEIPDSDDYALLPSATKASNSLTFSYPADRDFRVNLRKVLKLANITVTKGYRLVIPVEAKNLPGLGDCLVLHFTQRRMERITPRKKQTQAGQ